MIVAWMDLEQEHELMASQPPPPNAQAKPDHKALFPRGWLISHNNLESSWHPTLNIISGGSTLGGGKS